MPDRHLHIISFDVPYPPNYGGVIDVFYKVRALARFGIRIHLHCFEYGRPHAAELEKMCESVNYYRRRSGLRFLLGSLPYIVSTRNDSELILNLLKDNHPILFEGLHSCFYLSDERLKNRMRVVRSHNIEHDYYTALAQVEKKFFKRRYFRKEAVKLKHFEQNVSKANHVIAISPADARSLSERYGNASCITAFHPDEKVGSKPGRGAFALYHGNMAVGENNQAALFLIRDVFSRSGIPLVIAGNHPSRELISESKKYAHISLRYNITTEEILQLVREAQLNILPTFQATGIKLKLLSALFNGRHCIVNSPMVANTGLESLCSVKDTAAAMANEVKRLFETEFDVSEKARREDVLLKNFSNGENAKKLVRLFWNQ